MIDQVRKAFNGYLKMKLRDYPDLLQVIYNNELKEKVIEKTAEELAAVSRFYDMRTNNRYQVILESSAHLYMRRLISTLEERTKSAAEMTRIKRQEENDQMIQRIAEGKLTLSDKEFLEGD